MQTAFTSTTCTNYNNVQSVINVPISNIAVSSDLLMKISPYCACSLVGTNSVKASVITQQQYNQVKSTLEGYCQQSSVCGPQKPPVILATTIVPLTKDLADKFVGINRVQSTIGTIRPDIPALSEEEVEDYDEEF